MTSHLHLKWLALFAGMAVAGVVALSPAPSGATIVCPSGVKPPSPYCTNVPPTATTLPASKIKGTSAQLNGSAGPNVQGGDITQYFFQYGLTTGYGSNTTTGTIGSCPSGISPPSPYCNVPKTQLVSAKISSLAPCTTYHFRAGRAKPRRFFQWSGPVFCDRRSPSHSRTSSRRLRSKPGQKFAVKFTLKYAAKTVKIFIKKKNGTIVTAYVYGSLRAGKHTKKIKAPKKTGDYQVEVFAKLSCGQQSVKKKLKVR